MSITRKETLLHYGYFPGSEAPCVGVWPNNANVIDRLASLPEAIKLRGGKKEKIRIVFDYDPDFSKALLQVWGLPNAISPLELNNQEEAKV